MKKCKNPQCLTQISENAPDFCPDHNPHPHTHKEEPRSWEEEFENLLATFNINQRAPTRGEVMIESAVKSFIKDLLSTREKKVREEMVKGIKAHPMIPANQKITDYVSEDDTYLVGGDWLTSKTEIR